MRKINPNSDRRYIEREIVKSPGRQISIHTYGQSPIRSATAIKGDSLYEDPSFQLRDKFEFDIDNENPRSNTGMIISRENIDKWRLELASARYIFDRNLSEKFTDVEFTELTANEDISYGVPIIDQFEYENVTQHISDPSIAGARRLAYNIGEPYVLSSWANGNIVFVINAYNYENKKGKKNRENIQYTWYFSADIKRNFDIDVQMKVIGRGRKLFLSNVQRSTTGRYFCEVTNDKGVSRTIAQYVNVYRDGVIIESMGGPDNNIPLGRYYWGDISTTKGYDIRHPKTRPHKDYILEEEKWVDMEYNPERKTFERKDLVRANGGVDRRPWNTNDKISWVKENSMKGNTTQLDLQRKQGYWKYIDGDDIYWSDSNGVYAFENSAIYLDHREEMGYKKDFSDITSFNRSQNNPYILDDDNIIEY